jgi:hypothetical protein
MSTAKHVYFQSLYYGKYDFNLPNTHNTRDTTYSHDEKRKKKKKETNKSLSPSLHPLLYFSFPIIL